MSATFKKVIPPTGRELVGSPYPGEVGDIMKYKVNCGATVTIDGNCYMKAYKGTTLVTSSVTSGSLSSNGNIVTLPTIQNEEAGEYRYIFRVLVNGSYIVYFFRRIVERESGTK